MILEINDAKLKDALNEVLQLCEERLGSKNYALFGQIDVMATADGKEYLIIQPAVFVTGGKSEDVTKPFNELEIISVLLANRKSVKFEKEALSPILEKYGYRDDKIIIQ